MHYGENEADAHLVNPGYQIRMSVHGSELFTQEKRGNHRGTAQDHDGAKNTDASTQRETRATLPVHSMHDSPVPKKRTRGRPPSRVPPAVTRPTKNWPTLFLGDTEHSTSASTTSIVERHAAITTHSSRTRWHRPTALDRRRGTVGHPPLFHRRALGLSGFVFLCCFCLLSVPSLP